MSSSLLLQQSPTCLVRLIWMIFVMGVKWPHSCCFVGCCLQDLLNTARSILVSLSSSFFSIYLVNVHVVHPYNSTDTTIAWKKTVLFYRTSLISTWPIASPSLSTLFTIKHTYSVLSALKWRPMAPLPIPDYVAGIRLGRVYLPELLCHRRSLRPKRFVQGIVCFFPLPA